VRREALLRQPLETALVARITDLCAAGRKIQAIKELRDATGLGLKDAKDLVEAIQAGHRPAPLVQGEILAARVHTRDLADRARKLMADGQEVQAIRLVCDETGMGIADAQKFVKAL
jgi:ribosomal protein L7/L12